MNEDKLTASSLFTTSLVSRRGFLMRLLGSTCGLEVALPALLTSCSASNQTSSSNSATSSSSESATTDTSLVRLSSVVTPKEGGLYDHLLPDFERQTGYQVEL